MKGSGRVPLFKAGYEGERDERVGYFPGRGQAVPEEGAFEALEQRIQRAMLTLTFQAGDGPSWYSNGTFWPSYVTELADRIEAEKEAVDEPRPYFKPTGGDIDDMLPALALLEGFRVEYFQLLRYKASDDFFRGGASWTALGDAFGRSDTWARDAYRRAMTQAAKRAGLIFAAPTEHAVVAVAVMLEGVAHTWIGASADAKQTLYDLRAKNLVPIVDAFAVWASDRATARSILDLVKGAHAGDHVRGGWHRVDPFTMDATIMGKAEELGAAWRMETLESVTVEVRTRVIITHDGEDISVETAT
ncbi:hypothetical protein V7S57_02385 [Caulobacter sp. CCNWLY153]|uniref:hypothetical protein n=1 Tax=unclassified Caulobacter TaxID=2648921 RepID=UPI002FF1882E